MRLTLLNQMPKTFRALVTKEKKVPATLDTLSTNDLPKTSSIKQMSKTVTGECDTIVKVSYSTLNYKDALSTAVDLKGQERLFDDMQSMARYTLQDLKEATNNEVEGTSELQCSCERVANDGKSLIQTVVKFAETMLNLAERKDALIEAKAKAGSIIFYVGRARQIHQEN